MRSAKWFVLTRGISHRVTRHYLAAILFSLACAANANAQSANGYRWLSSTTDAATWARIQAAFQSELKPDAGNSNGGPAFQFKFLERVGVVGHSALVVVGHKTAKTPAEGDEGERFSSAFSYDLKNGTITKIELAQRMWHWRFEKLVRFEPSGAPDVAFTYLNCWECQPSRVLSVLRYDAAANKWAMRQWQPDKLIWWTAPDGLVVDADILEGADDTLSFFCVYGLLDLSGSQSDNMASRCHEVAETSTGKMIATDVTVIYSLDGGRLKIKPITDLREVKTITAKLCARESHNPVCKLPAVSTYNSQELTMLGMFPTARNTRRDAQCFRTLHGNFSIYTLVDRCGRPDAGGGTAIGFFEYRLDDGSKMTVHWKDMQHVLDIVQSDKSGQTETLLASK